MKKIFTSLLNFVIFTFFLCFNCLAAENDKEQNDWLKTIETPYVKKILAAFEFNGEDDIKETRIRKTRIHDGVLHCIGDYSAGESHEIHFPVFDFKKFSLVIRFKPESGNMSNRWIITGGRSLRWFGINYHNNTLNLTFNNQRKNIDTGMEIEPEKWYTLALSFNYEEKKVKLILNNEYDVFDLGEHFLLDVLEAESTEMDRNFSFYNYSTGGAFKGEVDFLRFYDAIIVQDSPKIATEIKFEMEDWLKSIEEPHRNKILAAFNFDGKDIRQKSTYRKSSISDGVLHCSGRYTSLSSSHTLYKEYNRVDLPNFNYKKFSFVIRFKAQASEQKNQWILVGGGSFGPVWFSLDCYNNELNISFNSYPLTAERSRNRIATGITIENDKWYTLALSFDYDSKDLKIVMDGQYQEFMLDEEFLLYILERSGFHTPEFSFWNNQHGGAFKGEIDYLRFYDGVIITEAKKAVAVDSAGEDQTIANFTGIFANRNPEKRVEILKTFGGTSITERSVEKALKWFVGEQEEDGSWGDADDSNNQKVKLTCYVLLAYLAHGDLPGKGEFGETIKKGLNIVSEWAETNQYSNAGVSKSIDLAGNAMICSVLSEAYAMTRDLALERGMKRVVNRLLNKQRSDGSFYSFYNYVRSGESRTTFSNRRDYNDSFFYEVACYDSSLQVSAFAFHALFVAHIAWKENKQLQRGLERAVACMIDSEMFNNYNDDSDSESFYNRKYDRGDFQRAVICASLLYMFGQDNSKAKTDIEWITEYNRNHSEDGEVQDKMKLKMDWKAFPCVCPAQGWYHMTNAMFQSSCGDKDNKIWKRWNTSFSKTLLKEQNREGFWVLPADKYPKSHYLLLRYETDKNGKIKRNRDGDMIYSRKPQKRIRIMNESVKSGNFSEKNGRIWSTALCTLMLEVYYRYVPSIQTEK